MKMNEEDNHGRSFTGTSCTESQAKIDHAQDSQAQEDEAQELGKRPPCA
jgi:hypothetical protein